MKETKWRFDNRHQEKDESIFEYNASEEIWSRRADILVRIPFS